MGSWDFLWGRGNPRIGGEGALSLSAIIHTEKGGEYIRDWGKGEDASRSVGPERVGKFGNFGRVHSCIFSIGVRRRFYHCHRRGIRGVTGDCFGWLKVLGPDRVDAVMKEREKARKEEATLIKLEREKRRRRIRTRKAKLHIENEKKKNKMQEEGK